MIYHFKVVPTGLTGFPSEIEAEGSHTFYDVHLSLHKALDIPPCQMASFFVYDQAGKKEIEIAQVEMNTSRPVCYIMRKTPLEKLIHPATPFIRYTFDLFNDRYLILELTGINMEKNLREPVVRVNGNDLQTETIDEVITDDSPTAELNGYSDYGVLDDYYEVFGDIEELTL